MKRANRSPGSTTCYGFFSERNFGETGVAWILGVWLGWGRICWRNNRALIVRLRWQRPILKKVSEVRRAWPRWDRKALFFHISSDGNLAVIVRAGFHDLGGRLAALPSQGGIFEVFRAVSRAGVVRASGSRFTVR